MTHQPPVCCVRWAARLLSAVFLGVVLLIFVGDGGFNPFELTSRETVLMVLFWTAVAGLVIAWWREALGGALTVIAVALFHAIHWYLTGSLPKVWFFALMAVPGLLFLITAALAKCCTPSALTGESQ